MNIGVQFNGHGATRALVQQVGENVSKRSARAHLDAALILEKTWKTYLAGPSTKSRIGRKTGHLGRSITTHRLKDGAATGTSAPYARIHELGGKTKPRVIRPRTRKALKFNLKGKVVFAKRVNHPGSRIPKRPHMAPSLKRALPAIEKVYEGLIDEAIRKAVAASRSIKDEQTKLAGLS